MLKLAPLFLLVSCATNRYAYDEAAECPTRMSREMLESGAVRCKAECASWGRNFRSYSEDCRCICEPASTRDYSHQD